LYGEIRTKAMHVRRLPGASELELGLKGSHFLYGIVEGLLRHVQHKLHRHIIVQVIERLQAIAALFRFRH
jgi:hypothetical protein